MEYDSQWSNFTFLAGPIRLHADFFSPVIPDSVCHTSLPLSYLAVSFETLLTDHRQQSSPTVEQSLSTPALETEKSSHDVRLYADIDGSWTAGDPQAIDWGRLNDPDFKMTTFEISLANEVVFGEAHERATWGSTFWTTSVGSSAKCVYHVGRALDMQSDYIDHWYPPNMAYRPNTQKSDELSFAFVHTFPNASEGNVLYSIGNIQQPAVQYLGKQGLEHLDHFWRFCYYDVVRSEDLMDIVQYHFRQFQELADMAADFEDELKTGKCFSSRMMLPSRSRMPQMWIDSLMLEEILPSMRRGTTTGQSWLCQCDKSWQATYWQATCPTHSCSKRRSARTETQTQWTWSTQLCPSSSTPIQSS